MNRWLSVRWWVSVVAVGLVAGTAGLWAGAALLTNEADTAGNTPEPVLVEVTEASVGRSVPVSVTAVRESRLIATNGLTGIVTSVADDAEFLNGDTLYAVGQTPVRVIAADTPFWRDLSSGVDGEDTAALQRALADLEYYDGPVDGKFRWSTEHAVMGWQQDLGIPATGTVVLGEIVAVVDFPAPLRLGDSIQVGARLGGGEEAVFAVTGDPVFYIALSEQQQTLMPPEAVLSVSYQDIHWPAVIGEHYNHDSSEAMDGSGVQRRYVTAPDGGVLCGDDCDALPAVEQVDMPATVEVVPEVSGPAIPVAAIRTQVDGSSYVVLADGHQQSVTVLGSSGGIAVVEGVQTGQQVQVFADPADTDGAIDAGS